MNEGTYSRDVIMYKINEKFMEIPDLKGSYIETYEKNNKNYTKLRLNINKTFKTSDYDLVFYDVNSFTHCNYGNNKSAQIITYDATLGWILGFRDNQIYHLTPENVSTNANNNPNTYYYLNNLNTEYNYDNSTNICQITGDTTISINLYNYFLLVLNDYAQNHINDGLVTITPKDRSIPLQSYANRMNRRCNPSTGNLETAVFGQENNEGNFYNQLSNNEIYAGSQIVQNQQSNTNTISAGPYIQDIFGMIPIKAGTPGTSYVEFGGTLQIQERSYFGPVNIHRMSIQLLNDKGGVVDLNGQDWSFSFIVEQLYSPKK